MNIVVHYPTKDDDIDELRKRTAQVHAQAVVSYISKLNCSNEQKKALIDSVIQTLKGRISGDMPSDKYWQF